MPQEFESPAVQSAPTEAFAAQQKVTPGEISAALTALHEQQPGPLDADVDLSIGQVLDELDLPLSAGDLWREVQAQRARAQQVPPINSVPAMENARPARRGKALAGTLAVALALLVPILRYARISSPPEPPAASRPAPSALPPQTPDAARNDRSEEASRRAGNNTQDNRADTNTAQNSTDTATTASPQNSAAAPPQTSGEKTDAQMPTAQNETGISRQTAGDAVTRTPQIRLRPRLPEPGNIINADNQVRTLNVDGGIVVIGGNKDTVTAQGRLDQMIVNGNRGTVFLRGPVKQVILGGNGNTVSYPRAFPAPQVVDNGAGNSVSPR